MRIEIGGWRWDQEGSERIFFGIWWKSTDGCAEEIFWEKKEEREIVYRGLHHHDSYYIVSASACNSKTKRGSLTQFVLRDGNSRYNQRKMVNDIIIDWINSFVSSYIYMGWFFLYSASIICISDQSGRSSSLNGFFMHLYPVATFFL